MCGCCLEVCPNFSANGTFAGTVAAVNAFRILNEEQESTHLNEISAEYKKRFFEGCGKSLSCHDICPIGLLVHCFTDVAGFFEFTGSEAICDRTNGEEYKQDRDQTL